MTFIPRSSPRSPAAKSLAAAAVAVLLTVPAAGASTLDFDFSFDNLANGGGTVTGVIRGLQDNATGAASSVEVLTNTAGFGVGEFVGNPPLNSWTVASGAILSIDFASLGDLNVAPAVTGSSLAFSVTPEFTRVGLTNDAGRATADSFAGDTLTFTARPAPAAVIPLPAAGWLLLGGLGALAGLGARQRRRAA